MASDPRFVEFIRLFNTEFFFEAHEVLEDLWLECTGDQKRFYQGLIQCAVAFAHWKRQNPKGARQVADRALTTLRQFGSEQEGVCVAQLVRSCESFFAEDSSKFPQIQTGID